MDPGYETLSKDLIEAEEEEESYRSDESEQSPNHLGDSLC